MTARVAPMQRAKARPSRWTSERLFFPTMAGVCLLLVFVGFAPSYYLRGAVPSLRPLPELSPLIHLHAFVFSLWTLLFAAQSGLIAGGRPDWHRRLGIAGVALAFVMVVVGTLTALQGVARESGPSAIPPLQWLAIPLFDMVFFAALVSAALVTRRDPQTHKRLMLIVMIGLVAPAVARMPLPELMRFRVIMVSDLLVLALLAWDWRQSGRIHGATLAGGLALIAWRVVPVSVWDTAAWLGFAVWAARLVN